MFVPFANVAPYKTKLIKSTKERNIKMHKHNSNGLDKNILNGFMLYRCPITYTICFELYTGVNLPQL